MADASRDSPANARVENSLIELLEILGATSNILHHLSHKSVQWTTQTDKPDALPEIMLFGTRPTKEHCRKLWIYVYPPEPNVLDPNPELAFFPPRKGETLDSYTRHGAFEGVRAVRKVLALAKYYFMRKGVEVYFPISKTLVGDLKTICLDFDCGYIAKMVPKTSMPGLVPNTRTSRAVAN
ncbi:hypothetical protein BCR34DRAFT_669206 [Clohesyomyces aquaticus]|uniref:Uncharacterized protein n=1 Tax=Clohesyomyces aquaticus TaxID=1231657 RepID=A0A1Y1YF11_9PLEO|nr:hypothetical protein BCR34DRAFT_669206 [Clohesyomyces aquaticus]